MNSKAQQQGLLTRQGKSRMGGFSLLELVMVLAVIGMLITLAIPMLSQQNQAEYIALTDQKLEQIRQGILGERAAYDDSGTPVAGGYVGDMSYLPALYKCEWDNAAGRWKWDTEEAVVLDGKNRPLNQPRGLWMDSWTDQVDPGSTDKVQLAREGSWSGPYIYPPTDKNKRDTAAYEWDSSSPNGGDNDVIRMNEVEGRLSDGWGRAFLFWREDAGTPTVEEDDVLWVVSEGADNQSAWKPDGSYPVSDTDISAYDPQGLNEDNQILKIRPNEWYAKNVQVKVDNTEKTLEKIRTAIVGPKIFDEEGQPVINGYVGDVGNLPKLYKASWNDTTQKWEWDTEEYAYQAGDTRPWGQPRGLWKEAWEDDLAPGDPAEDLGENWAGSYMLDPRDLYPVDTTAFDWSEANDQDEIRMRQGRERLTDAWGRQLLFWKDNVDSSATLYVVSEGRDRKSAWTNTGAYPVTPTEIATYDPNGYNTDNVVMKLTPSDWVDPDVWGDGGGGGEGGEEGGEEGGGGGIAGTALLAVKDTIDLGNNAFIDAYDSAQGPYDEYVNSGSYAVVTTNNTQAMFVEIGNNADVQGDLYVGPGGDPNEVVTGAAYVTGTVGALDEEVPIPDVNMPGGMPANEGAYTLNNNQSDTFNTDRHFSDFTLKNNTTLTIDGNVRIQLDSDFSAVKNNARIVLTAGSTLDFYIAGEMLLYNNSHINRNGEPPSSARIYLTGTDQLIRLRNNAEMGAQVFNPKGLFEVENNALFFGTYMGKDFDCSNNGEVHLDINALPTE